MRSTPDRGRGVRRLSWVATIMVLVVGCTASPSAPAPDPERATASPHASDSPQPSPPAGSTPSGAPAPTRLDVPVTSSSLGDRPSGQRAPRPVSVELARLGAAADVEPVGVADDGQMEIPQYAETAGWYRFGASPGEPQGTAVIAAHVDSIASRGLGPFAALAEAREGDEIEVRLEDGSTVTYVVETVDRQTKTGIDWDEVFVRDGPARLVLITCGGRFLRDLGHYEDNVLVTAARR